jgi:5'-nucleotidase (lipoprotein e(P4) family)
MKQIVNILLLFTLTIGCTNSVPEGDSDSIRGNEELIMATLYNYYSAEYIALSIQAYNIASERLLKIASENSSVSNLAVVVDIDETILDNSPFQAKTIESGEPYPAYWDEWCNLGAARAVPGALEFLRLADSLGFGIFYISNRKIDPVYKGTFDNLEALGFPQISANSLMLREKESPENINPSNKELRREKVESQGYTIVLLAGDNLGDFFTDSSDSVVREGMVKELRKEFGTKYIVLPNAMYGNWPESIGIDGSDKVYNNLIKHMTAPFNKKL